MNRKMRKFSECEKNFSKYVKEHESQIYHSEFMPPFDVRGYVKYIRDHKLSATDITPEILQKFLK